MTNVRVSVALALLCYASVIVAALASGASTQAWTALIAILLPAIGATLVIGRMTLDASRRIADRATPNES